MRTWTQRACSAAAAVAASALPLRALPAQPSRPAEMAPQPDTAVATSYDARYQEITHLAPVSGEVAQVANLEIVRDAGRIVLERGTLVLLTPVGGRTVGAVFEGAGRFRFAAPLAGERARLRSVADTTSLDVPFDEAILLYSDSTPEALRGLSFGAGPVPGSAAGHVRDFIGSLEGTADGTFADEVAGPLLNGERGGLFLARLARIHGGPLLFEIDPAAGEAVRLWRPASHAGPGVHWSLVSQFPLRAPPWGTSPAASYRQRLQVRGYRMDVRITEAFSADLALAAAATLTLFARDEVGPWLEFGLAPKLTADSARWADGTAVPLFKANDDGALWVRAPRRLQIGDSASLTVYYHGDMIQRFANMFFVDPGAAWYPRNRQGSPAATFDVTFHSPARYPLIGIGARTDSSRSGTVVTTRWVAERPTPFATFNLGLFESYHEDDPLGFPVDVLYSEEAHREIRQQAMRAGAFLPEQGNKQQAVAGDVSNALKFFTSLFGPCPFTHFYATEIPYPEGVSFPGMIDFSFGTFQTTSLDGFDEYFRAHETAHQWWGNGVWPGSYRDAWLSEGLASFSALWYVQAERRRSDDYFRFLDQYRSDILAERGDAGAIWDGYRAATDAAPQGYQVTIYEKGAWIFNMLRVLLLDLRTMGDARFIAMLKDYYQTYDGVPASTGDFQRVVEQHAGMPMDWFFDEWVRGTGIPTYHVAWRSQAAPDGKYRVQLRVRQEGVDSAFHMPVLVAADLGGGRTARFRVDVRGGQTDYTSPLLPSEARSVTFNDLHAVLAEVKTEGW